ncbi:MAG: histidine phosphatase family protein [Nakamurella sp.]
MLNSPTLHLVRHGQSAWNEAGLLQGQTDHPELTELGRAQAGLAADALAGTGSVRLLTSDLRRAKQTAEIIGRTLGLTPISTSLLREQSFGLLEGLSTQRARARWKEATLGAVDEYGDALPFVDVRPAGGESMRDVLARVGAVLATPWVAESTGNVVIVSHGDTLRILLAHVLGDDFENLQWREIANGEVHSVLRTATGEMVHTRSPNRT